MDKREEIPEWALEEATRVYGEIGYTVGHKEPVASVIKTIALAISQARSQAYEECAKIADEAARQCEEARGRHAVKSELRISNHAGMTLARDLAQAIREAASNPDRNRT